MKRDPLGHYSSIAHLFSELAPGTLLRFRSRMKKYGKTGHCMVVDVLKRGDGLFALRLLHNDAIVDYNFMGPSFPGGVESVFTIVKRATKSEVQ